MKSWMKRVLLALLIVTAGLISTGLFNVKAEDVETIAPGVYIGNIYVGGMTETEARTTLQVIENSMKSETYVFWAGDAYMELEGSKMGISLDIDSAVEEAMGIARHGTMIDRFIETKQLSENTTQIELPFSMEYEEVAQYIILSLDTLEKDMVPNDIRRYNGAFEIIYGESGREIRIPDSITNIVSFFKNDYQPGQHTVELAYDTIEPGGSEEELGKITDLLATFTTDYSSSTANRKQNVENGISKINGTLLYPGQELSVYDTVKPFTEENGYELAKSYGNGRVVESFGGGICQVSTTLYNAVIRAELEVTERYNHTMLVHYVNPSEDAAIASEVKDLKFKNNTGAPIYIEGYWYNGKLTFNIYGQETRPSNRKVTFESETVVKTDYNTVFELDSSLAVGTYQIASGGYEGCDCRLWKIVTVDGVEESREVFNSSHYQLVDRKILVGTSGATSEQYNALVTAINSGDESTVISAVSAVKN